MGRRQAAGPAAVATAERRHRALELRKAGASYHQIAMAPGSDGKPLYPGGKGGAQKAVTALLREMAEESAESVAEMRQLEAERLSDLYRRAFEVLVAEDGTVKLAAVSTAVKVSESLRKLLGLDAAAKFETTGPDGAPIEVRIAALAAKLPAPDVPAQAELEA